MSLGKNAPDPNDVFVLQPGEAKVLYERDTKMRRTGTFIIEKEDHTIGNVLRQHLLQDPEVLFAGYKMPHPLEQRILLKIRTTEGTTPPTVFAHNVRALIDQVKHIRGALQEKIDEQAASNFLHSQF